MNGTSMLLPLLVSGGGRTGTTLLMQLLGTDQRCVFDRNYPLEGQYLSYIVYFVELFNGRDIVQMSDRAGGFAADLGQFPIFQASRHDSSYLVPPVNTHEMFAGLWEAFCRPILRDRPDATFYAEKTALWLPPLLSQFRSLYTIYSIRDPRDTLLSIKAFSDKRQQLGFGRKPTDTDSDYALRVAERFVSSVQNYKATCADGECSIVRYEDLIADPVSALQGVTQALGVKPTPSNIDAFYNVHRTTSDKEASVSRWKKEGLPESILNLFETNFYDELVEFGYGSEVSSRMTDTRPMYFSKSDDSKAIIDIAGGEIVSCGEKGLELTRYGDRLTLRMSLAGTKQVKEVWICIAGDFADSYELRWCSPGAESDSNKVSTAERIPGDHYRVVRIAAVDESAFAGNEQTIEISFERKNTQVPLASNGWLKWVRCITINESRQESPLVAPAYVGYTAADTIQQQSAHIEVLSKEYQNLTDLVGRLQRHIAHIETERDKYKSRWATLSRFLPLKALIRFRRRLSGN